MAEAAKSGKRSRFTVMAAVALLFILLILGFRSCTPSDEDAVQPSNKSAAASPIPKATAAVLPQTTPFQAQSIPLNDRCAPFSPTSQMCHLVADETGSGYIGLGPDFQNGARICFDIEAADFKSITRLLADGTEEAWEDGKTYTTPARAMKFVPKHPLVLIYYGRMGSCHD
jgi:hypothetical protein